LIELPLIHVKHQILDEPFIYAVIFQQVLVCQKESDIRHESLVLKQLAEIDKIWQI